MFHKGMTGRTDENGPASVKNDIGKRGGQELYLRDYITRKQESDAFFTGESMTTTPTLREAAQQALEALEAMLRRDERNTCQHKTTHRAAIWTICDDCGMKWADDRGGKPRWKDPQEWGVAGAAVTALRAALAEQASEQAVPAGWRDVIADVAADISDHPSLAHEKLRRLLASAPAPARQEPLTDAQIAATYKQLTDKARQTGNPKFGSVLSLARAVERAHGITAAPAEGGAA